MWTIEYYSDKVQEFVWQMPVGIRAHYARIIELILEFGVGIEITHSKPMGNGLFELRPRGKEGIARLFYCTLVGKRIVILHGFIKKSQKTPRSHLEIAIRRMKEVKNEWS